MITSTPFTPRNRLQQRRLYRPVATRTVFLLSLISLLKYPKQRDMNRAPTSLNAIVGP
jgi:hypothetical protein